MSGSNLNDLKQALTLDLQHFEPSNVYGLGNTANKIRKILKSLWIIINEINPNG